MFSKPKNLTKHEKKDKKESHKVGDKLEDAKNRKSVQNRVRQYKPQYHNQKKTKTIHHTASSGSVSSEGRKRIDEDSVRGRFGWDEVGEHYIPYIFRAGEKYCSIRIAEQRLLNKYRNYMHNDVLNCTRIKRFYVTEAESRLLNEINTKHCDYLFGRDEFKTQDTIVLLSDVIEYYNFLKVCYVKLTESSSQPTDQCGFIRINNNDIVAYTTKDGVKYTPLFYFDTESGQPNVSVCQLDGWDLSYLRFCCTVQGIRNELFARDTCDVVNCKDIKQVFASSTTFEYYWPDKDTTWHYLVQREMGPELDKVSVPSNVDRDATKVIICVEDGEPRSVYTKYVRTYGRQRRPQVMPARPYHVPTTSTALSPWHRAAPQPLIQPPTNMTLNHFRSQRGGQHANQQFDLRGHLIPIPEYTVCNIRPYKIHKCDVLGKMLFCINMQAYIWSELLVTLPDFVNTFFHPVHLATCRHIMHTLQIDLYRGNRQQMQVLMAAAKCRNLSDELPLVHVRDAIRHMPKLSAMLNCQVQQPTSNQIRVDCFGNIPPWD